MRIAVLLDRARLFRWHQALVEALRAGGHHAIVRYRNTQEPLPTSLTAILDFDHARTHADRNAFSTHIKPDQMQALLEPAAPACDLTLDLSSSATIHRLAGPVMRPMFDGSAKDYALFHALLDRQAPHLTLWHSEHVQPFDIGTPALETPSRLATSLDQTTSRLVEGILRFFTVGPERFPIADPATHKHVKDGETTILASAGSFLTARTLRKVRRLTDTFSGNAPQWHVAWRKIVAGSAISPASLHLTDYRILSDDTERSYCDPFLIARDGKTHIFMTEVPEATGIGVIAHAEFTGDGFSTPRKVLATGDQLAHPFVFAHGGDLWMLPEQPDADGLDLYRCTDFPEGWQRESRLIDARLHDATLFAQGGLLWIAAASEAFQSSAWDGLALYWATDLKGPWHPHPLNPVVVDAHAARPAGALWQADGALYRPAQDCAHGFGSALSIRRVVALTPETFAEDAVGSIAFQPSLRLAGPHAISRCGGLEVVDLYARPSAIRLAFRAGYRSPIGV